MTHSALSTYQAGPLSGTTVLTRPPLMPDEGEHHTLVWEHNNGAYYAACRCGWAAQGHHSQARMSKLAEHHRRSAKSQQRQRHVHSPDNVF